MTPLTPPDLATPLMQESLFAPSWSGPAGFLNDEHRGIHESTSSLPGWQDPPDSQKLYEMGYHAGQVILEIGVYGGRSAVVELRGALAGAAARSLPAPQYYGIDIDPQFFERSSKTLRDAGLAERCVLYHGDLRRFLREVPIVPTMVFVDGDHMYGGVRADLEFLADVLAPGTPVLCHDYWGIEGVRRAVNERVGAGECEVMGSFSGSILLRARGVPGRVPRGLTPEAFDEVRAGLWARYSRSTAPMLRRDRHHTPVRDITLVARREVLGPRAGRLLSGRASWPYSVDAALTLPATLPDYRAWPRISVVTPSFNQGRFIEQTVLSVINQRYPNLEYIVMDGGSTDETLAVLDRYRDRINVVMSERDGGQSDAINKGFARATGEVLTWLNADDMLAPGGLGAAALAFGTSGADMVAGELRAYRDGTLIRRHLTWCGDGPLPLDDLLDIHGRWLEGQFFYQPEVLFTRAIWEKAGGRVDADLYHSMDYELWVRMAEAGARLHVIGRPLALFRVHPDQKTAGDVVGGFRAELPRVQAKILDRLKRPAPAPVPRDRRPRLRIAMFNDLGYAYGAGIAHRRLAHALALAGHGVHTFAAACTDPVREPTQVTGEEILARLADVEPDLVVVGNLHGADLDATVLGRIVSEHETAFVMHDLWLLTGRCAYPGACRRYLQGCHGRCTCPGEHPRLAPHAVRGAWEAKRRVLTSSPRLTIWANSAWTLGRLREAMSAMPLAPGQAAPRAEAIRLGVETEVFRPRDRMVCRDVLGLPRDRFIILSSASSVGDARKGLAELAGALDLLQLEDAQVVCAGWIRDGQDPPIRGMRAMGYMRDPERLAMLYSAADIFVGPSIEEAFGQVFIEAAACGTPSVGFPVGGVPEAIRDGVSGRLAAGMGPEYLADTIDELYCNADLRLAMGRWGRLWVENEWSIEAASRCLSRVLATTGVAERAGLVPRIQFRCQPTAAPEPLLLAGAYPGWRAISGFEAWGGPFPERGLPRCRWACGPVAVFDLHAEASGPARVLIACRSHHPRQRIRLVKDGCVVGEHGAPKGDRVVEFRVELARGCNRFEMHLWKWRAVGKPLGLIVKSITAIAGSPSGSVGSRERVVEVK